MDTLAHWSGCCLLVSLPHWSVQWWQSLLIASLMPESGRPTSHLPSTRHGLWAAPSATSPPWGIPSIPVDLNSPPAPAPAQRSSCLLPASQGHLRSPLPHCLSYPTPNPSPAPKSAHHSGSPSSPDSDNFSFFLYLTCAMRNIYLVFCPSSLVPSQSS